MAGTVHCPVPTSESPSVPGQRGQQRGTRKAIGARLLVPELMVASAVSHLPLSLPAEAFPGETGL